MNSMSGQRRRLSLGTPSTYEVLQSPPPAFPYLRRLREVIPAILLNQGFNVHVPLERAAHKFVFWFGFRQDFHNLRGGDKPCDLESCGSFYLADLAPAGAEPERKSLTATPAERLKSACFEMSVHAEVVSWSGVQWVAFLPLDSFSSHLQAEHVPLHDVPGSYRWL
jgi:hypothetical protein